MLQAKKQLTFRSVIDLSKSSDLLRLYPLPPAPDDMCRDQFLRELLQDFDFSSESYTSYSTGSSISSATFSLTHSVQDNEGQIFRLYRAPHMTAARTTATRMTTTRMTARMTIRKSMKFEDIKLYGPDLNKLLRERYGNNYATAGFVGIALNLKELMNIVDVLLGYWHPVIISSNKTLKLFSWSIEDNLKRLQRPNQSYLDTFETELGSQAECFKFCVDLQELLRLLSSIYADFTFGRNMCKNSLAVLKDAQLDIVDILTKSKKEAADILENISKKLKMTPRSADPKGKIRALQAEINHDDFVYPIESRYCIKWADIKMDQFILRLEKPLEDKNNELEGLRNKAKESKLNWEHCGTSYETQILELKNLIIQRELLYQEKLEDVEYMIQATYSKIAKTRDDLKFYKDQLPLFHTKIAEVQAIMSSRESHNRELSRRSKRNSKRMRSVDKNSSIKM